jgi:hypothetical protein
MNKKPLECKKLYSTPRRYGNKISIVERSEDMPDSKEEDVDHDHWIHRESLNMLLKITIKRLHAELTEKIK